MDTQGTMHPANQKVSKNHTSVLFILIIVLIIVAVVVGYMRLMEKQTAQEKAAETKKIETVTEKGTTPITTSENKTTATPSDEVTDIEADLKTTDVSF